MKRTELPRRTFVGLALVGLLTSLPAGAAGRGHHLPAESGSPFTGITRLWSDTKACFRALWGAEAIQWKNGGSLDPWGQPATTLPSAPTAEAGTTGGGIEPLGHP